MFNITMTLLGLVLASREGNSPAQSAIGTTLLGVGLNRVLNEQQKAQ